jgi:hypothetical protein
MTFLDAFAEFARMHAIEVLEIPYFDRCGPAIRQKHASPGDGLQDDEVPLQTR